MVKPGAPFPYRILLGPAIGVAIMAVTIRSMPALGLLLGGIAAAATIWAGWPELRAWQGLDDLARPRMRGLPPKPRPPVPRTKQAAVIVRTYKQDGPNSEKKVAALYEKDAQALTAQGYEPVLSSAQNAKPASLFMGGIGLWASGTLTVTYRLNPRLQAEEAAADGRRSNAMHQHIRELAAWRKLEDDAKAEHRRALAEWRAERSTSTSAALPTAEDNVDTLETLVIDPAEVTTQDAQAERANSTVSGAAAELIGPMPEVAPAAIADAVETIRRLAELRDLGALTDAEFQAKKTDLLSRV